MTASPPDDPIRILHVAQATVTGLAVYVTNLAAYQRAQGIDARIACPPGGSLVEWAERDGVPVFSWPATRQPGPSLGRECRRLAAIIDGFEPDIVHLHSSKAGFAGRLVLRGRRPTVFTPHAWSFLAAGWTRAPSRAWERLASRWTSEIIVGCAEEAEAGRRAGVRATYEVAEHGVDVDAFWYADDDARSAARDELELAPIGPVVVCVGRLCHQKGQKPLLEAWARVHRACPESLLLLVGAGEDEAALRAMGCDGVEFVGGQADVRPWLAAADVVAQPSRYEALSFSVLEAMSVGRSVVAFDGIGMRTAIGDEAGAVVGMDDVPALAEAILVRLLDPEQAHREGVAGRARVAGRFTVDRLVADATRSTLKVLVPDARTTAPRP